MRDPMRYSSCVDGRAEEISPGCPFTESWWRCSRVQRYPRLRPHFFNPRACCVSTAEEPPPDFRREISDGRCCGTHPHTPVAKSNATASTESKRSPSVVNGAGSFYLQAPPLQRPQAGRDQRGHRTRPQGSHQSSGHPSTPNCVLQRHRQRHAHLRAGEGVLHTITGQRTTRETCEAPAHHIEGATRNARCLVGPRSSSRTNVRTGFGHRYLPSTQTWSRGNNGKKRISRTDQIQALLTRNLVRHIDLRARKFLAGMAARLVIRKSGGAKCDELRGPLGLRKRFMSWKFARKNPRDGNASSYLQENGG